MSDIVALAVDALHACGQSELAVNLLSENAQLRAALAFYDNTCGKCGDHLGLLAYCPHCRQIEQLRAECGELRKDQSDWRKGVELIASALGEHNPPNLSCVRIAENALRLRAELEALSQQKAVSKSQQRRLRIQRAERESGLPPLCEVCGGAHNVGNPCPGP